MVEDGRLIVDVDNHHSNVLDGEITGWQIIYQLSGLQIDKNFSQLFQSNRMIGFTFKPKEYVPPRLRMASFSRSIGLLDATMFAVATSSLLLKELTRK